MKIEDKHTLLKMDRFFKDIMSVIQYNDTDFLLPENSPILYTLYQCSVLGKTRWYAEVYSLFY